MHQMLHPLFLVFSKISKVLPKWHLYGPVSVAHGRLAFLSFCMIDLCTFVDRKKLALQRLADLCVASTDMVDYS